MKILAVLLLVPALSIQEPEQPQVKVMTPEEQAELAKQIGDLQTSLLFAHQRAQDMEQKYQECLEWKWI